MKVPIYNYKSAEDYLKETYNNLKEEAELSLRDWSTSLGFESPKVIIEVLKKKKIH